MDADVADVLAGRRQWAVVEGDSVALLPTLPERAVDHVITDPPYAEKTHAGARSTRPGVRLTTVKLVEFASVDDEWFLALCDALVRVSRRWVVMTCDWRHSAAAFRRGAAVVRCGVWVKPDAAPQFTGDRPGTGWEAVLILHRKGRKRWNGGGHHAVWRHRVERGEHPCMKPLPLLREWVTQFTDPGDVVLDPFCGSGQTGVAALSLGRRFVGVEIDPAYAALARRRLAEASNQAGLFAGLAQPTLFPGEGGPP
jgi:site-specific DNA-methyltransferase (adenine-specific)